MCWLLIGIFQLPDGLHFCLGKFEDKQQLLDHKLCDKQSLNDHQADSK